MLKNETVLFIQFLLIHMTTFGITLVCIQGWTKRYSNKAVVSILNFKESDATLLRNRMKTYEAEITFMGGIIAEKNKQIEELQKEKMALTVQAATKVSRLNS